MTSLSQLYHELTNAISTHDSMTVENLLGGSENHSYLRPYYNHWEIFDTAFASKASEITNLLYSQVFSKVENYSSSYIRDQADTLFSLACSYGEIGIIKNLLLRYPCLDYYVESGGINDIFIKGRVEVLHYLLNNEQGIKLNVSAQKWQELIDHAIDHGQSDIIRYVVHQLPELDLSQERMVDYCYKYLFSSNEEMFKLFYGMLSSEMQEKHTLLKICRHNAHLPPLAEIFTGIKALSIDFSRQVSEIYIQACKNNRLDIIEYIVDHPDIKEQCKFHYKENSGFVHACRHGHLKLLDYLLFSSHIGIYIYSLTPDNFSLLLQNPLNQEELLDFFQKLGHHPHTQELFDYFSYFNISENLLRDALSNKKSSFALGLLSKEQASHRLAVMALREALEKDCSELPKFINLVAQELSLKDFYKECYLSTTALYCTGNHHNYFSYACYTNRLPVVQTLLQNAKTAHLFQDQLTLALEMSCINDNFEVFEFLLQYARDKAITVDLQPVFKRICAANSLVCLQSLFYFYPEFDTSADNESGFIQACLHGRITVIDYLLNSRKNARRIDFHIKDELWLRKVIDNGNYAVAKYLLLQALIEVTPRIVELAQNNHELLAILQKRKTIDFNNKLQKDMPPKPERIIKNRNKV